MTQQDSLTVLRCHDTAAVCSLLLNEYYDAPVCYFPSRLLRAAGKWLANSKQVYFMVGVVSGKRAGYVLGHTLGPRLWRIFAIRHIHLFPYTVAALLRQRALRNPSYPSSRLTHARPLSSPKRCDELALPRVETPFAWSAPELGVGYIEMVYVAEAFRGQGIAPQLLRATAGEMRQDGIRRVEAHIDSGNYASVRAFLMAGWSVIQTSTEDYVAYDDCNHEN